MFRLRGFYLRRKILIFYSCDEHCFYIKLNTANISFFIYFKLYERHAAGTQEDKQRFIDLLHARIDREREARKAVSQARQTLRRPDIYAYVERLGINSSLIRPHYELPITMVASSRKNKSRQGITIRKNKQPVSTVESSSSHLNRTESSHSNNVRPASNMIPSFPAKNSTDAHHIVSNRSSPSHFTKDSPFNTSQVRTRSTTKLNHCLENQKGIYLRYRNMGERSCSNSSQDD